jgi:Zn-finger nucleic acid-binding protein
MNCGRVERAAEASSRRVQTAIGADDHGGRSRRTDRADDLGERIERAIGAGDSPGARRKERGRSEGDAGRIADRMYRDGERRWCLRCDDVTLSPVVIAGVERLACTRCDGVWIDDDQLRELLGAIGFEGDEPLGPLHAPSAMACPVCNATMVQERAYGNLPAAVVDICPEHGTWFDRGELAMVIERLHLERVARDPDTRAMQGGSSLATSLMLIVNRLSGYRKRPTRSRGRFA